MPRTVLRMENEKHVGPFSLPETVTQAVAMWRHVPWIDATGEGFLQTRKGDTTHPHHLKDVLNDPNWAIEDVLGIYPLPGHWLVGCKDWPQFCHWFPQQALPDFARFGLKLDVWECPEGAVKEGRYQLLFNPRKSRLVRSFPLVNLDGSRLAQPLAA